MNVEILQQNLIKGIDIVQRFVPNKSSLPVLSNIKVWTKDNSICLMASNMETMITTEIPAIVKEEGTLALPSKLLQQYIKVLKSGKVTLISDSYSVKIQQDTRSEATINGVNPVDFPSFPTLEYEHEFIVGDKDLEEVLRLVGFSASNDEARPTLASILVDPENSTQFVTTDGYRLSLLKKEILLGSIEESLLFPAKVLSEVEKILSDLSIDEVSISINLDKKSIKSTIGDTVVISRLVEGDYPPYQKILPETSAIIVTVDRKIFVEAVKAAGLFSQNNAHIIKFKIEANSLTVTAQAKQVGNQETHLDAKVEGFEEPLVVAFNSRYVSDFLNHAPDEEIYLGINNPLAPVTFSFKSQADYLHVIMPVRTQD